MAGAQAYSTLEVDPRRPEAGLEVHHGHRTSAWNTESQYLQRTSDLHQKLDEHSYDQHYPRQRDDHESTAKNGRKDTICGLSRRVFIIVLVVSLLILIGAIAGGVAGGVLSRRNTTGNSSRCILDTSRLAAANRTSGGLEQRTVFFQDGSGALMARSLRAPSAEWATTNLTLKFQSTTEAISIPRGAPMAALACADYGCGETRLFYIGTDDFIHDVKEGEIAQWNSGGQVVAARLSPLPGSQIAVTFTRRLPNEEERKESDAERLNRLIAYQGLNGKVYVANDTDRYVNPQELGSMPNWTKNTSLAMITQFGGVVLDEVSLVAKGTGAADSEVSMIEARYDIQNKIWVQEPAVVDNIPQSQDSSSTATPQFAATMRNNWLDSIYLALNPDGTMTVRIIGQRNETMDQITLEKSGGELARFSAIATTMDGHLYGIVDDSIREYSFDTSDASILHLDGTVYDCSGDRST
ncbi:hypothetical protein CORC01_07369 [Colletotrichum orchidophilum]|uniref:Fucose-specific lectin n=1 Tax=Colletotrichum orchidophilum TaxID=1209926 RepID=A0A1G4B7E8_9PEZI|nr:uncharacterized protein CORC01_07369 [Colletotrichum orchidophilum]OHE97314.1 hypothetical protein CORC01_07369 [Colletotrichum orchidophilum]